MNDTALAQARRARDVRGDRVVLLRGTAIVAFGYAFGAALQAAYVYGQAIPAFADVSVWRRLAANAVGVCVLVGVMWVLRVYRVHSLARLVAGAVAASLACAVARWGAQIAFDVYRDPSPSTQGAELFGGLVVALVSSGIGVWSLISRRRARAAIRESERRTVHAEMAVSSLEQEEIRVRREVAEGLHGTLQNKLVVVDARLQSVLEHSGDLCERDAEALRWVRDELQVAREIDVRQMSRLLYPERLELGLVPAVRALLGRLPSTIATRLVVGDEVREVDDPVGSRVLVSERLLAVRVVEEGITNALKHGPATIVQVHLQVAGSALMVRVENDGELYDPASAGSASGTARLRERLELVGGTVQIAPGDEIGAVLDARIPLSALTE
ncbi:sensor histidine kinase [Cellulomonas sp. JH27-2]|uniref:sensor histidine kinase n=1 Tax=Cellulomonas sp. JH27-2 TaxID=2774139 RepID=UPI00351AD3A9